LDFLAVEPQSDRIHCCAERLTSGRFNTYDKRICSRQWARSYDDQAGALLISQPAPSRPQWRQ
jgi:hypothetical protein